MDLYKKLSKLIEQDYFEFAMDVIDDIEKKSEELGVNDNDVDELEKRVTMLYYERLKDEGVDKVISDLDVILNREERIEIIDMLV